MCRAEEFGLQNTYRNAGDPLLEHRALALAIDLK